MKRIDWNNSFKGLQFDESKHQYTYEDKQFISVTTFIDSFKTKIFDDNFVNDYALKHDLPFDYVKLSWDIKKLTGATKGTCTHAYIESYYKYGKELDLGDFCKKEIEYFHNFLNDNKYLRAIQNEYRIFDIDYMIAGTIDFIGYDLKDRCYVIVDWKSNKSLTTYNKTKMKDPLQNVFQSDLNCYGIQLCLYKILLEKNIPDLKIEKLKLVHLNESNSNYVIYDINMEKCLGYTNKLLESRKNSLHLF